jgi:phage baseplate assembly protein W
MANGISVALPLIYSKQDGPFRLNKTIEETIKQNFKNLILTIKGERLMDPNFGVGIYSYLFENYTQTTTQILRAETVDQIRKYMPFISIKDLTIAESKTDINQFYVYIKYQVTSLNVLDELSFVISK